MTVELAQEPATAYVHYPHLKPADWRTGIDATPRQTAKGLGKAMTIKPWQLTVLGMCALPTEIAVILYDASLSMSVRHQTGLGLVLMGSVFLLMAAALLTFLPAQTLWFRSSSVSLPLGLGLLEARERRVHLPLQGPDRVPML